MIESVGLIEGDICNRNGCKGKMVEKDDGGCCSCHINPPCSYCVNKEYYCSECGEEVGPPEDKGSSSLPTNNDPSPWWRVKSPKERFDELPEGKFGYVTIAGKYYWMEYWGKYPEGMGVSDIVSKFNTCFGYKWIKFPEGGVFHIKVYTD